MTQRRTRRERSRVRHAFAGRRRDGVTQITFATKPEAGHARPFFTNNVVSSARAIAVMFSTSCE